MLASSFLAFSLASILSVSSVQESRDYAAALEAARQQQKPLVVVLEDASGEDGRPAAWLRRPDDLLAGFQVCRIDISVPRGRRVAELYGAHQFPYTVITDVDCHKILFRAAGPISDDYLRQALQRHIPSTVALTIKGESDPKPFAYRTLADAEKASRASSRPLLVVVSMNPCHFCDKLKHESLENARVAHRIASEFESIVINEAEHPEWVQRQHVNIFPTTLILSPSGTVLDRIEGFLPADRFHGRLERIDDVQLSAR